MASKAAESYLGVISGAIGSVPTSVADAVCKLVIMNETTNLATGFFAEFTMGEEQVFGLFTCNHVLDEKYLRENDIVCTIEKDDQRNYMIIPRESRRRTYSIPDPIDAAFVRLYDEERAKIKSFGGKFLVVNRDKNSIYAGVTVGIPQYPGGGVKRMATDVVKDISGCNVKHLVNTLPGSSGSPLADEHGRVVGIHKQGIDELVPGDNKFNTAVFIDDVLRAMGYGPSGGGTPRQADSGATETASPSGKRIAAVVQRTFRELINDNEAMLCRCLDLKFTLPNILRDKRLITDVHAESIGVAPTSLEKVNILLPVLKQNEDVEAVPKFYEALKEADQDFIGKRLRGEIKK